MVSGTGAGPGAPTESSGPGWKREGRAGAGGALGKGCLTGRGGGRVWGLRPLGPKEADVFQRLPAFSPCQFLRFSTAMVLNYCVLYSTGP